ncbi:maintenance of mitochondrial morphology protein 1 [Trichomonascus vanleenenianus]|uniref:ERMES complex subunit MMM1 n=1 Tax=Trichomonascus vanleenenianus TaxID=2268995 RepID=UPI003EC9FD0D
MSESIVITTTIYQTDVAQYTSGVAFPKIEPIVIQKSSGVISSFAYGLLLGQLSVLVIVAIFIRFFIFADPPSHRKEFRQQRLIKVLPSSGDNVNTILEKTYYNVENHPAESLDWFTVLIAQTLSQVREDAIANDNMLKSLNKMLNGNSVPDFVDAIKVTELNIGDDYPIFSNCKILQNADEPGGLEAQIDVDLTDTITLGIETRLLLNFPKSLFAFLPVSLTVSIVRFSGRLTVSLKKSHDNGDGSEQGASNSAPSSASAGSAGTSSPNPKPVPGKTYLTFSFAPDYRLEFQVKSLVGARSRLQDVPKIGQIVESRLRKWFTDRCVSPRYQQIPLPSMWPRSKFTKEHTQPPAAATSSPVSQPRRSMSTAGPSPYLDEGLRNRRRSFAVQE